MPSVPSGLFGLVPPFSPHTPSRRVGERSSQLPPGPARARLGAATATLHCRRTLIGSLPAGACTNTGPRKKVHLSGGPALFLPFSHFSRPERQSVLQWSTTDAVSLHVAAATNNHPNHSAPGQHPAPSTHSAAPERRREPTAITAQETTRTHQHINTAADFGPNPLPE